MVAVAGTAEPNISCTRDPAQKSVSGFHRVSGDRLGLLMSLSPGRSAIDTAPRNKMPCLTGM